jgi:hypothetical protein
LVRFSLRLLGLICRSTRTGAKLNWLQALYSTPSFCGAGYTVL